MADSKFSSAEQVANFLFAQTKSAMREFAEIVGGAAQRDAPILEGILRGSEDVEVTVNRFAGTVRATISFNTPYAAKQHEELSYNHPRGGKAKYLESHVKAYAPEMGPFIAARIRLA